MKLDYFKIKGFRRILETEVKFGDATFLIGENNVGKSSVLKALEAYFTHSHAPDEEDFFKVEETGYQSDEIVLEGKLIDLPEEARDWRGFKNRIHSEIINDRNSLCIYYRKTYNRRIKNSSEVVREMKCFEMVRLPEYETCNTLNDFIERGISEELIMELFPTTAREKKIPSKEIENLGLISEIWQDNEGESKWDSNPGGIEGNISNRLPKFLLIPAEDKIEDIEDKKGVLQVTMKKLFEEVRDASPNYKEAKHYLDLLAAELDPSNGEQEFSKMIGGINEFISSIFTDTKLHITTILSDATSIQPTFQIEMSSNVKTKPERQGMGSIRSTVFALLRYRENFAERKKETGEQIRTLIIGFEEPEMYLHPNAASLMRDTIYELATSSNSKIICTTHSPYMIDLSKKIDSNDYPSQVLNLFKLKTNGELNCKVCVSTPFNTSEAYQQLQADDKDYIKFILKIDDYIAKVFFCKKVIIIEGDTEEIILKETVRRLPFEKKILFLADFQIVKARGKATIISLIKYLKVLSIMPFVIHDNDTDERATRFNAPILAALDNIEGNRFVAMNTIEDVLGYSVPTSNKPFTAYKHINEEWGENWSDIPEQWRYIFESQIAKDLFSTAL